MSREQVATTLRLPPSIIAALEEEDYSGLPPAAFVRGYLSGYARLVGLDATELVAACEIRGCGDPALAAKRALNLKKGRGETLLRWGSYGALAAFVIAAMTYWISIEENTPTAVPAIIAAITATHDTGSPGVAPPPRNMLVNAERVPARPPAETSAEENESAKQPTLADNESTTRAGVDPGTWPTLDLEFKADSWVAVRDAEGKRLAWETVKAGSSRHLRGNPPLKVVLGNANAVRVTFEGEQFDPTPFTSGRIARFSVE